MNSEDAFASELIRNRARPERALALERVRGNVACAPFQGGFVSKPANVRRELAEIQDAEWPDTYCPSEPKVCALPFNILDEYIEVMRPAMLHIGYDEWRMPLGVCPRCRGQDPTELCAADLNPIYSHLRAKGVGTAIWGDHLIKPLRGKKVRRMRMGSSRPFHSDTV